MKLDAPAFPPSHPFSSPFPSPPPPSPCGRERCINKQKVGQSTELRNQPCGLRGSSSATLLFRKERIPVGLRRRLGLAGCVLTTGCTDSCIHYHGSAVLDRQNAVFVNCVCVCVCLEFVLKIVHRKCCQNV